MASVFLDGRSASVPVRAEVAEFAVAMEAKLKKNDHKTGWQQQPIEAHIKLLKIEVMEFDVAFEFLGDVVAAKECVDIANFALILRDKLLARVQTRNEAVKQMAEGTIPGPLINGKYRTPGNGA